MSEAFITFDQEIITIEDIEKVAKSGRFVVSYLKSLEEKRLEYLFRSRNIVDHKCRENLNHKHKRIGPCFSKFIDIIMAAGIQDQITADSQEILTYHYKGIPDSLDPRFSIKCNHPCLSFFRPFDPINDSDYFLMERCCRLDELKNEIIVELLQSIATIYKQWDDENQAIIRIFENTKRDKKNN